MLRRNRGKLAFLLSVIARLSTLERVALDRLFYSGKTAEIRNLVAWKTTNVSECKSRIGGPHGKERTFGNSVSFVSNLDRNSLATFTEVSFVKFECGELNRSPCRRFLSWNEISCPSGYIPVNRLPAGCVMAIATMLKVPQSAHGAISRCCPRDGGRKWLLSLS